MALLVGNGRATCFAITLLTCAGAAAQTANQVSFANDVAPILSQNCMQCHGQTPAMAELDLRSRDGVLKGGQHGPAIVPGDAAGSRMFKRLTGQEQPQMPMGGRLTDHQIEIIKNWI